MTRLILCCAAVLLSVSACGQEGGPVDAFATDSPSPVPTVTEEPEPTATDEPEATPEETTEPTEEPEATPGSWERIEHGGLSFELRSDMEDQKDRGIDSQVGAFEGVDIRMEYDYGAYSGDPADEKAPGYEDQWTRIDDRLVHISYYRRTGPRNADDQRTQYEYIGTAYFPDTEDTSDSTPKPAENGQTQPVKLNMIVYSNDGFEDPERIIQSIRFED